MWVRLWADMPNDPKWRTIARVSKQKIGDVMAVFVHMMTNASQADERGYLENWSDEDIASALDLETENVTAIREAMQGRVLDGDRLKGWETRQPHREDGSAERAKAWREKKKSESEQQVKLCERNRTQPNAEKRPDTDTDTDTDTENKINTSTNVDVGPLADASEPPARPALRIVKSPCPYQAIVDLYHEVLPRLRRCRALTETRKGYLRQRWNDKPGNDLGTWRKYFEYVSESPFLMGDKPGTVDRPPFEADLEWLCKPSNLAKVLEGKYHGVAARA